jgi:hypothetical protein
VNGGGEQTQAATTYEASATGDDYGREDSMPVSRARSNRRRRSAQERQAQPELYAGAVSRPGRSGWPTTSCAACPSTRSLINALSHTGGMLVADQLELMFGIKPREFLKIVL